MLLEPTGGPMPATLPVQVKKQVADRELIHPSQKKIDVVTGDQAQIEQVTPIVLMKPLQEHLQHIAFVT